MNSYKNMPIFYEMQIKIINNNNNNIDKNYQINSNNNDGNDNLKEGNNISFNNNYKYIKKF